MFIKCLFVFQIYHIKYSFEDDLYSMFTGCIKTKMKMLNYKEIRNIQLSNGFHLEMVNQTHSISSRTVILFKDDQHVPKKNCGWDNLETNPLY